MQSQSKTKHLTITSIYWSQQGNPKVGMDSTLVLDGDINIEKQRLADGDPTSSKASASSDQ